MTINVSKLNAASFMPGLQNVGIVSGQALVSGTLNGSPNWAGGNTSNMTGTVFVSLPDPTVISVFRVNLPNASGELSSRWFPLFGEVVLNDEGNQWLLLMYIGSATGGRNIYINFVNTQNATTTFTSFPINIYGHLYSYPW